MFTGTNVAMATEMTLSLLEERRAVTSAGLSVDVPPMEIQAFFLLWSPH